MSAPEPRAGAARVISAQAALSDPSLDGQVVRVGGRVLVSGASLGIADAFASVAIELGVAPAALPRHGSIAIAEGTLEAGALVRARLIAEHGSEHAGLHPEFERLHFGGVGRALQLRARVFESVRRFFAAEGFLEVDTPLISAESSTEPHIEPLTCSGGYLVTSPELYMKRLLVAGVHKLYQLGHCFRAEELGPWHSPEFTLLEWYRAFASHEEVLSDTERLLSHLCREVRGSSFIELSGGARVELTPPFARISVREAFALHAGENDAAALAERDEDAYFQLLVDRVEPALAKYPKPVFLCDYPVSQAALARRSPSDASVAERFELYLGGVELCNGYGELTDAAEQRRRCELDRERRRALGRPVLELPSAFLGALEHGMPPASGNAVGLDRVIALLAGRDRIDDVRPFPDSK